MRSSSGRRSASLPETVPARRPTRAARHGQAARAREGTIAAWSCSSRPTRHPQLLGESAFWLWRAGALDEPPDGMEEPYHRSIAGDWAGAAREWERRGCPFQTAEALSHADEAALLRALEIYTSKSRAVDRLTVGG